MSVRSYQGDLIREFLLGVQFRGRVLDYGCDIGPYRDIIEREAEWHGFNRVNFPSGHKREDVGLDNPLDERWDTIVCTQVLQYVSYPAELIRGFRKASDRLVLTYATNWPEVEPDDLFRYTRTGMEQLLATTGWNVEGHRQLGAVAFEGGEMMALGYGVVAS